MKLKDIIKEKNNVENNCWNEQFDNLKIIEN